MFVVFFMFYLIKTYYNNLLIHVQFKCVAVFEMTLFTNYKSSCLVVETHNYSVLFSSCSSFLIVHVVMSPEELSKAETAVILC